ncbi:MAG: VWA domain-containing protein [Acidobacteria bacterium]|nr:VWA domain-containing protein [Acidobacteriota bacterium]
MPRFRGGANLVRVDAYVSADGQPVTGLTVDDFEVLEDDQPQKVENFEFIDARNPQTISTAPTPTSTRDQANAADDSAARVFVLFLDAWHISIDGSARSAAMISTFLDKVVGPNDLVGIMTPDMSAQNITLVKRGDGLDRLMRDAWSWGQRDRVTTADPRESEIRACYPDIGRTADIAEELIGRRREQKTLRAVDALTAHLGQIREDRKFVVLLSEGWMQYGVSNTLARPLDNAGVPGGSVPVGVGTSGRLETSPQQDATFESCERERVMLAYIDNEREVRQMAQRANRANVTFYTIDPRGLVVFDTSIGGPAMQSPQQDREGLERRREGLRLLADQTDGAWSFNTNDTGNALARMTVDTGSYYLLSYYSSNAKPDGRFRRLTVRVKRENVDVRARPGYLAPTETEARAAGANLMTTSTVGVTRPAVSPAVSRALGSIPSGRSTAIRIQAAGLAERIRVVVELDPATLKEPEWQSGGTLQVIIESERGGPQKARAIEITPGQRSVIVDGPDEDLAPGRYFVRVEGRGQGGGPMLRASTDATVGATGSRIGSGVSAFRRGPTTGLAYQPTADPRFRRTERLRAELPLLAEGEVTISARILTREGQPLPLQVSTNTRADDEHGVRYVVADVTLAPLAQGDYVLEVAAGPESATFGFRIIP